MAAGCRRMSGGYTVYQRVQSSGEQKLMHPPFDWWRGGEICERMERLNPILERTRFMHGRIANSGCIQAPVGDAGEYVGHFRAMWQRCFEGFLSDAQPGDYLSFNPEILPMRAGSAPHLIWLHYAQQRPTLPEDPLEGEPTDRFLEADTLWSIASAAFETARMASQSASRAPCA